MKKHFLIIIFLLFYFGITAYKFVTYPTPFYDWDESIYAQVGREMVRAKSIVPLWQGQYWLDKPPLAPLAYGIVETISPLKPELSTRLFTLSLTILLFIFIYYFYYKLTKNECISFLTVVISSFTTIFLQRAQVLNVDIFLFLGWMGYLVFFENFWLSFLFLAIGVLSKSLLGFYPALLYFFYLLIFSFLIRRHPELVSGSARHSGLSRIQMLKRVQHDMKNIIIQVGILSLWYVGMFLYFKYPFIQAHFLDSHLKRVTASIESHFGKRTFYVDLLFEQIGLFAYFSIIGLFLILKKFLTSLLKKTSNYQLVINNCVLFLFFVPWFLFLNLTKTKINWYLYPVIPQFAFLGVYLMSYLKQKKIVLLITLFITGFILYSNLSTNSFLGAHYSSYDENYNLAMYAKDKCKELIILVDKGSRTTHDTLKSMNLLINTSEWWGNHPSLVYYSDKKVNFMYEISRFQNGLNTSTNKACFVVYENDIQQVSIPEGVKFEKKFRDLSLYIRQ